MIFFFLCNTILLAQDCSISIQGRVVDEVSQLPLSYVNVYLQETSQGAATDNDGRFFFKNVCVGHYHIIFSHIGCEDSKLHIDLERDTVINVDLDHSDHSLGTVVIQGPKDNVSTQPNLSVNRKKIEDSSNQNL
ncbi:MAG TPA: TonB-dependent receptor, partial [Saprospirales bacterium]|nr:TonB-dependent receptor [Saprospirales bacterium]